MLWYARFREIADFLTNALIYKHAFCLPFIQPDLSTHPSFPVFQFPIMEKSRYCTSFMLWLMACLGRQLPPNLERSNKVPGHLAVTKTSSNSDATALLLFGNNRQQYPDHTTVSNKQHIGGGEARGCHTANDTDVASENTKAILKEIEEKMDAEKKSRATRSSQ